MLEVEVEVEGLLNMWSIGGGGGGGGVGNA